VILLINLKSYVFTPAGPDYSAAKIMKQVDSKIQSKEFQRKTGLVSSGFVEVTYSGEGIYWSTTDLIEFPFKYTERPIFTWGLDAPYSGHDGSETPDMGSSFNPELPDSLVSATTFSPAIFVPRVIHWYKLGTLTWNGCYLLICQVNSECNEKINKVCRVHFRFEGTGYLV
jgi:hypothetical protein